MRTVSLAVAAYLAGSTLALADACVTQDGSAYVQVATSDPADMKHQGE